MDNTNQTFIQWFRDASPYINTHRGKTFVLMLPGEACEDDNFHFIVNDIALLNSLGIRLVLVHGAQSQISSHLTTNGFTSNFSHGLRVTETEHMPAVSQAVGAVKVSLEAALSAGLPNSPMQGAHIKTVSGNFVTAMPRGIIDGIDFQHTGKVRRIDTHAINHLLDEGSVVLVSNLGYSLTGEIFNLSYGEVASQIAIALHADKIISLTHSQGVYSDDGSLQRELSLHDCEKVLPISNELSIEETNIRLSLNACYQACRQGVIRAHLISYQKNGALLEELFSRDGSGTMIHNDSYELLRQASIEDVGGILELLEPLEKNGVLVRRSRELLETEITKFKVIEKDGTIIACAALYPFPDGQAEIACVATHLDYQKQGRGALLLRNLENSAAHMNVKRLFILTTQTAHWFIEQGFQKGSLDQLPADRQNLYNLQRKSQVLTKAL
ncbi:MAG: amino-acid N-acetyltransferase [Cellvibrionaceae bacterium]